MPFIHPADASVFDTHGSQFLAYVSPSRGSESLCAWRLSVPPGLRGVAHRPTREEILLVLAGALEVTIDGIGSTLQPGDVALIPAGSELQVDGGPAGAIAWVTTTPGLEAVTSDGVHISPAWAQ